MIDRKDPVLDQLRNDLVKQLHDLRHPFDPESEALASFYKTESDLKLAGWTDEAIEHFLGNADDCCEVEAIGSSINLYDPARVNAVEESDEWWAWFDADRVAKFSDLKSERARFEAVKARIVAWVPEIKDVDIKSVSAKTPRKSRRSITNKAVRCLELICDLRYTATDYAKFVSDLYDTSGMDSVPVMAAEVVDRHIIRRYPELLEGVLS